jgi:hypothetical protein
MNDDLAKAILDRLTAIEGHLHRLNNPLSEIQAEEKGRLLAKHIKNGDKAGLKAAIKQMNGRV